jgi:hypothetical protein
MENRTERSRTLVRAMAVAVVAVFSLISLVPGAQAGPKGTDRPIKGACEMDIRVLSEPATFPMLLALELRCHLSHLGLTYGGTPTEIIVPVGPPHDGLLPIMLHIERMTYMAANGDELWSRFIGYGEINLATHWGSFEGIETYTGGTGRFDGATGQSSLVGAGSPREGGGYFTTSGALSY